jgi:hypothetical protein
MPAGNTYETTYTTGQRNSSVNPGGAAPNTSSFDILSTRSRKS